MTTEHDWSRADAMTEADIHAAALADIDAQPLNRKRLAGLRRAPRMRVIRRALGLSQDEFAARFHIPIGTLRDWEQGRKDPDAAARAYLTVIGRHPGAVSEALHPSLQNIHASELCPQTRQRARPLGPHRCRRPAGKGREARATLPSQRRPAPGRTRGEAR